MTGPTAHWSGNLTRYVDKALKRLETDHLDVLMTFWVGVTSTLNEARFEEMVRLRSPGRCGPSGAPSTTGCGPGKLAARSPSTC